VPGERQAHIEDVVGRDRRSKVIRGLVAQVDHRRRPGFGGEGDRDHPDVLAVGARDFDQRLVVMVRDHLELAFGQALATLGTLEPAGLAAKDIEQIHGIVFTPVSWAPAR